MREPHAVGHPRFRLRWLATQSSEVSWLHDDDWVPSGNRALFSRVKQGLHAALSAADRDGPVLLPAYVPGGVAWAAMEAGFDVQYYPVNADLSLPVEAVRERIAEFDPGAIVFVHYFGFVDDAYEELSAVAESHGALVVEDCARGLFSRDRSGQLLGSTGDVALFCLHKTLPVPNGGIVVTRHTDLAEPRDRIGEWWTVPRVAALSAARLAGIPRDRNPTIERPRDRSAAAVSPSVLSSRPGRLTERGLSQCHPERVRSTRQGLYRSLRELLVEDDDIEVVSPPVHDGTSPYGVAALAPSTEARFRYLRTLRRHVLPCDVLTWPPICRHAEASSFAGAETLRSRLIVFPTHQQLDGSVVGRIAQLVRDTD